MAAPAAHVIPSKTVSNSQGVYAVFILEVIWLIQSPICEVTWLVTCPSKSTLTLSVIKPNPAFGSIQAMLHVNILFLICHGDEVGVVILAGFLSFSPVLASLTRRVTDTRKVWPTRFTYVYRKGRIYIINETSPRKRDEWTICTCTYQLVQRKTLLWGRAGQQTAPWDKCGIQMSWYAVKQNGTIYINHIKPLSSLNNVQR